MKLTVMNLHRAPPESGNGDLDGRSPFQGDGYPAASDLTIETTLQNLRQHILNRILIVAILLGAIAYLTNLSLLVQTREWLVLGLYTLVFVGLVVVALQQDLPYNLRATALLLVMYAIGALALVNDGLYGSGRVYLITLPFIAALLMGLRGGIAGLVFSIGAVAATGILMSYGLIPAPGLRPGTGNGSLLSWLVAAANFALLVVTGVISLGVLVGGLEKSLGLQRSLYRQVERARSQLEDRVRLRTADLERRLVQIRTAAEISSSISQITDIDVLLSQVCELARQRFNLYYVGIFLVESSEQAGNAVEAGRANLLKPAYAILAAGSGEAGQRMVAEGHRLLVGGDSMIGWATANHRPRIALDTGQEATRFSNPYLPNTRSEMALPILAHSNTGEQVLGALTIQSEAEAAFDQDDVIVLQGIADSLASAIVNARLLASTRANLEEISALHRQYLERAWAQAVQEHGKLEYLWKKEGEDLRSAPAPSLHTLEVPIRLRDEIIGNLTLEFGDGRGEDAGAGRPLSSPASGEPGGATGTGMPDLDLIQPIVDAVINQAALALENARLLEETRIKADQERIAANISGRVWSSSNVDAILRASLEELGRSLGANQGAIQLWTQSRREPNAPDITPGYEEL